MIMSDIAQQGEVAADIIPGKQPEAGQQGDSSRQPAVNVGHNERIISVAAGSIAALIGLSRRSLPGFVVAGIGGALVYRGVTGHCPAYEASGIDTSDSGNGADDIERELNEHGITIAQALLISRPAEQLYAFWRNFENLPQIMTHLESVQTLDGGRSHWVAKMQSLAGKRLEWDAEITSDEPNQAIAWRSLPGADVDNTGEVRFQPALGDRGTEVHIRMKYLPPAGRVGHWIASLAGSNPKSVIREDLRNFKRLMELGEIPTVTGQPRGTCMGQGKYQAESRWKPLFT
jgi:uncharacterized membrane protein